MLLPHWTDGCIGSMEGLFFEATASTNYHFITAAAISESSSNPVRQLRYTNNDADVGVRHMQDLGVRYLMVRTDAAKAEAATNDGPRIRRAVRHVGDLRGTGTRTSSKRSTSHRSWSTSRRTTTGTSPATTANATSNSARAGSRTVRPGRRCPSTTGPTSGSGSPRRSSRTSGSSRSTTSGAVDYVAPDGGIDPTRSCPTCRCPTSRSDSSRSSFASTRSACRSSSRSATSRTGRCQEPMDRTGRIRTT